MNFQQCPLIVARFIVAHKLRKVTANSVRKNINFYHLHQKPPTEMTFPLMDGGTTVHQSKIGHILHFKSKLKLFPKGFFVL